jgi:hypothetical protein
VDNSLARHSGGVTMDGFADRFREALAARKAAAAEDARREAEIRAQERARVIAELSGKAEPADQLAAPAPVQH